MDNSTLDRGAGGLKGFFSTARAVARGVMGSDAYDKYLAHHARAHASDPAAPAPMTEKEFWREKMDRQDSNPQGRCC